MCFGDYVLYKGSHSYQMNACDTIEVFYPIRTDLDKLKYAVHITKIINDVTTENQNSYKILQLFLNTLYVIAEKDLNLDFVLAIFRLKVLSVIGFTPQIRNCVNCKDEENITHFSVKENGFLCSRCAKQDTSSIKISMNTKNAIQYIVSMQAKKIYSFNFKTSLQKGKNNIIIQV